MLQVDQEDQDDNQACDEGADGDPGDASFGQSLLVVAARALRNVLDGGPSVKKMIRRFSVCSEHTKATNAYIEGK